MHGEKSDKKTTNLIEDAASLDINHNKWSGPKQGLNGCSVAWPEQPPYSPYTETGTSNRDKLAMSVRPGAVRLELGIDSDA